MQEKYLVHLSDDKTLTLRMNNPPHVEEKVFYSSRHPDFLFQLSFEFCVPNDSCYYVAEICEKEIWLEFISIVI